MSDKKVLIFDIETAPVLAYVWGLKDQNIGLNQIHSDWHVMAWGAKWLGDPASKVMYRDQRKEGRSGNDKALLKPLWNLLNEADIVITQNGVDFDSPKINARFILNGMKPPSPYLHLDTYKIVKSVARFTSHKLEYLTDKLCVKYKKLSHGKFPGMSLWTECLNGNIAAWDEMKKYNVHDVLSTEELYLKIKAWTPQQMPDVHMVNRPAERCRVCGKKELQRRGFMITKTWKFQRFQCQSCGAWSKGPKAKSKEK